MPKRTHDHAQDLLSLASACETALVDAGQRLLGKVHDSERAIDLALVRDGRSTVVRCVCKPRNSDQVAIKTMIAQGDFTRAAIVYTAEDEPHLSGEIETYPLSRIDELAASLARESAS